MTTAEVKEFEHKCDELVKPTVLKYAVISDKNVRRSACFGNAKIDEQTIFSAGYDSKYLEDYLGGNDFTYSNCSIYFFPREKDEQIDQVIAELSQKWMDGTGEIGYSEGGEIYFAKRKTANGTFLLTYDGTSYGAFVEECSIIEKMVEYVDGVSPTEICAVFNYEEASAEDFFTYLSRREKEMLAFVKSEGLFDDECVFKEEYA